MSCNIYGTKVISLTEFVEQYFLESGNYNENHYMSTLLSASRVWNDLLKDTVWVSRQRVVNIGAGGKVVLPKDMVRLISIGAIDENNRHVSLDYDRELNTLQFACRPSSCGCNGSDTLCDAVNSLQVRTEEVNIDGTLYETKIWTEKGSNGDLVEYRETPFYNTSTLSVETQKTSKILCNLELNEDNCIKPTVDNKKKLSETCGCYIPEYISSCDVNDSAGKYNYDAHDRSIVYIHDTTLKTVVVTYQSDGQANRAELQVPVYAIDAMQAGVVYRQQAFNKASTNNDKEYARRMYVNAKDELFSFLNPIRFEHFDGIISAIPKW